MSFICLTLSLIDLINNNITINEIPEKISLYFLYIIGYGELEEDLFIQNILAILGIISLALMTTYLTIELFWRDTDIKVSTRYENNKLYFNVFNKGNNICDEDEYYIPLIDKHTSWLVDIDLDNTFWFNTYNDCKLNYIICYLLWILSICINEIKNINISIDELLKAILVEIKESIESNVFLMQYANFHDKTLNL